MARSAKTTKTTTKSKAKSTNTKAKPKKQNWESRAVKRPIEAGASQDCPFCEEQVSFKARERASQVICNIYENGVWVKVEHYHEKCYTKAKKPYGKPLKK